MHGNTAFAPARQDIERSRREVRRVEQRLDAASVQLLGRLVSRKHETLILGRILVPELRSLAIEGTRAATHVSTTFKPSLSSQSTRNDTHLFGSPNKLCKLNSTVPILYTALHLSFRISRQMRPLMSTLG
jgi:hypothetical protein